MSRVSSITEISTRLTKSYRIDLSSSIKKLAGLLIERGLAKRIKIKKPWIFLHSTELANHNTGFTYRSKHGVCYSQPDSALVIKRKIRQVGGLFLLPFAKSLKFK
jgi:hypothetical protein